MLNKVTLHDLYVLQNKSIPDIACMFSLPRSRVRKLLIDNGIVLRSRAEGVRASRHKLGKHMIGNKRKLTDEWKEKISAARLNSKNTKGTRISSNGYIEYTTGDNKGRGEHVVLMENHIGRKLSNNECVHHINHIRDDNRLENLMLMSISEHMSYHAKERISNRARDAKGRLV